MGDRFGIGYIIANEVWLSSLSRLSHRFGEALLPLQLAKTGHFILFGCPAYHKQKAAHGNQKFLITWASNAYSCAVPGDIPLDVGLIGGGDA